MTNQPTPEDLRDLAEWLGYHEPYIGANSIIGIQDSPKSVVRCWQPETDWRDTGDVIERMEKKGYELLTTYEKAFFSGEENAVDDDYDEGVDRTGDLRADITNAAIATMRAVKGENDE